MYKISNLLKGFIILFFLCFVLKSCRKDDNNTSSKDFMDTAKKYYQRQLSSRPSRNASDINIKLYKANWSGAVYTRTPSGLVAVSLPMIGPSDEYIQLDIINEKDGNVAGVVKRFIPRIGKLLSYTGNGRLIMTGNYNPYTNEFVPDERNQFASRSMGGDLNDVTITPDNPYDPSWPPLNPPNYPPSSPNPSSPSPSNPPNNGDPNPQDVVININNPCIRAGVIKALNENVKSKIRTLMTNTFMANSEINLDFSSYQFPANGNAPLADAATTPWNATNLLSQQISFNENVLPNKSEQYIVATVYHEILHAYFANLFQIDQEGRFIVPQDHEYMATNYIYILSDDLQSMYPGMSDTDAWALAWGGLERTSSYNLLSASQRETIRSINEQYSTRPNTVLNVTSKGSYCP